MYDRGKKTKQIHDILVNVYQENMLHKINDDICKDIFIFVDKTCVLCTQFKAW